MQTTQMRIGGTRVALKLSGSLGDAADHLATMTRTNIRAMLRDPRVRDEAIRRVMTDPCVSRCYVSSDGTRNDCDCNSGFQWTTDGEAQAMMREGLSGEGCPARDVWNDFTSLMIGHADSGRGHHQPIAADCDCLTPVSLAVAGYLAWFAPERLAVEGVAIGGRRLNLGSLRSNDARFAVGITLPPDEPGKERVGHAYGLMNRMPRAPQPPIKMPFKDGGPWWVWDASAHWGMTRPSDSFYTTGEFVGFEVSREGLGGLK